MPEIQEREIVESEERLSFDNKITNCELLNKMSRLKFQIDEVQKSKQVREHRRSFKMGFCKLGIGIQRQP